MTSRCLGTLAGVALLLATASSHASDRNPGLLEQWHMSRSEAFSILDETELADAELLFARSLDRAMQPKTKRAWGDLGFEVRGIRIDGDWCHLLFETPNERRGRGMFLLCPIGARAGVLLAPHGFHDRFTAKIAALLAIDGRFRAVAWNTLPRRSEPDNASDFTHATESYFTALARAAAVIGQLGPTIELHGFAPHARESEAGRGARAIVSSGSVTPDTTAIDFDQCLGRRFGERLLLFPTDVQELGGLRDRVGSLLRSWGRKDFLHVEFSHALRLRLLEDRKARRSLIDCLGVSSQ